MEQEAWTQQIHLIRRLPGPRSNIKMYRKSHCRDKTAVRSSYLHNGISYTKHGFSDLSNIRNRTMVTSFHAENRVSIYYHIAKLYHISYKGFIMCDNVLLHKTATHPGRSCFTPPPPAPFTRHSYKNPNTFSHFIKINSTHKWLRTVCTNQNQLTELQNCCRL